MTTIDFYDPTGGPVLPELPPLPIGVLAVGARQPAARSSRPAPAPVHHGVEPPSHRPAVRS